MGVETKMTKIPQKNFMAGLTQPLSSGFWLSLMCVTLKSWLFFLNLSKASLNDDFITISLISKAGSFAGGYRYIKSQWMLKYSSRGAMEHFLPFISCRGSIYL